MEQVRIIECSCGQWEELSVDEQRWHTQTFKWIENDGDEAVYECPDCGVRVRSEVKNAENI